MLFKISFFVLFVALNIYLKFSYGLLQKSFFMLFCVVRVLDLVNLVCLIGWIMILLWRKAILKYLTIFPTTAFHIEITPLADGTYELTQEPDGDISEAQANVIELTEVPNSDLEEPKSIDSIDTTTGKPRCIILLF